MGINSNTYNASKIKEYSKKLLAILGEAAENSGLNLSDDKAIFNYLNQIKLLTSIVENRTSEDYELLIMGAVNILSAFFQGEPPTYVGFDVYFTLCVLNQVKEITLTKQKVQELFNFSRLPNVCPLNSFGLLEMFPNTYNFDKITFDNSYDDFDRLTDDRWVTISRFNQYTKISVNTIVLNGFVKSIRLLYKNCSKIILGPSTDMLPEYIGNVHPQTPVILDITNMSTRNPIKITTRLAETMPTKNIVIQRKQEQKLLVPKPIIEQLKPYIKTI